MAVTSPQHVAASDAPRNRGATAPKTTIISMRSRGVVSQPEDRHKSREVGVPYLTDTTICKVENVDTVAWEFKWNKARYLVKPKQEATVPFPALKNALGDPRSVPNEQTKFRSEDGQTGIILTRHESIRTLFARYAVENENIAARHDGFELTLAQIQQVRIRCLPR